jgi:hypothetical protein
VTRRCREVEIELARDVAIRVRAEPSSGLAELKPNLYPCMDGEPHTPHRYLPCIPRADDCRESCLPDSTGHLPYHVPGEPHVEVLFNLLNDVPSESFTYGITTRVASYSIAYPPAFVVRRHNKKWMPHRVVSPRLIAGKAYTKTLWRRYGHAHSSGTACGR